MAATLRRLTSHRGSEGPGFRTIHLSDADENDAYGYPDNHISTTKYHWYSFIPKGLWEQFRRVANMYFLFQAIISVTPVTPVNPITTILPLVFVVGVAMIKELLEDIQRGRQDSVTNNSRIQVLLDDGTFEERKWKDLQVGDIVKVEGDHLFPADLLCLSTSLHGGACYVETMNLDGETNLKLRGALGQTQNLGLRELANITGRIEYEKPNPSIYSFLGNLIPKGNWANDVDLNPDEENRINLNPSQILLRGCCLRNTKHVIGLVIFTGFETKVMMNATDPPSKRSLIEQRLDYLICFELILLFSMSLASAIAFAVILRSEIRPMWYLQPEDISARNVIESNQFNWKRPILAGLLNFFTSLALYGYFVPISLYVSIEIVKLIQSKFMNADKNMYYEEKNIPPRARTSNLNEELGMIQTILSDKTGTLTRNQMEFFKCSIGGIQYGTGVTEVERAVAERSGIKLDAQRLLQSDHPLEKGFNMRDSRLEMTIWPQDPQAKTISRFLQVLSLCHTVIPEGPEEPHKVKYLAESPDELAFVVAAKRLGYFFHSRHAGSVTVSETGRRGSTERDYAVLQTLEFSSARKRMSVVVRDPEGELMLLCKGADSVIMERLSPLGASADLRQRTQEHLTEYAEAGLRTLAIAWKPLNPQQYEGWARRWQEAKEDVSSGGGQALKLESLAEEMERDLILLGATAIEDKLQVGVPQTIDALARAGIRLWVLTGDKLETAVNIGYACSLLRHNMNQHVIFLEDNSSVEAEAHIAGLDLEQFSAQTVARQIQVSKEAADLARSQRGTAASHAVVIDGKSLAFVLKDEALKADFLALAKECESVICCRVSPMQKALITELVRHQGHQVCLAVGDGANDVGMIQKANIGVGISGEEGNQAVMASDFSIGQFRFLERLLLVHGAWSYRRISFMVNFFFYKNFVYGFTVLYYNAIAHFSGASVYYDWYLSLYNVLFSAFPICVVACIDQDVSAAMHLRFPRLYRTGQKNRGFTVRRIALWLVNGVYQSAAIFFVCLGAYWLESDRKNGMASDYLLIGTTMYTVIVFVINFILFSAVQYWTWIHHLAVWGEVAAWFIYLVVWGSLPASISGGSYKLFFHLVTVPSYYLIVLLALVAALLPDFILRASKRNLFPDDHHIIQELQLVESKRIVLPLRPPGSGQLGLSDLGSGNLRSAELDPVWKDEDQNLSGHQSPLSMKAESFRESWSRRATDELSRKIAGIVDDDEDDQK